MPPPGSRYDPESKKKVIIDEDNRDILANNDDERLARILTEIANNIMPAGLILRWIMMCIPSRCTVNISQVQISHFENGNS